MGFASHWQLSKGSRCKRLATEHTKARGQVRRAAKRLPTVPLPLEIQIAIKIASLATHCNDFLLLEIISFGRRSSFIFLQLIDKRSLLFNRYVLFFFFFKEYSFIPDWLSELFFTIHLFLQLLAFIVCFSQHQFKEH